MTLKEMKIKVFSLIEEYYPNLDLLAEDEDVLNKINGSVNQIIMDLMKYKKIPAHKTIEIEFDDDKTISLKKRISDMYQLNTLHFNESIEYEMPDEETLILPDNFEGEFTVYYYKYPKLCTILFDTDEERQEHDTSFTFDLSNDLLEIAPYGIAADLLKMDMISNYGQYFYNRYLEMKNNIDSRRTSGMITISGGYEV